MRVDDIDVGRWITVQRGMLQKGIDMMGNHHESEWKGYNGVPMKVLAINLPYIVVQKLTPSQQSIYISSIHTHEMPPQDNNPQFIKETLTVDTRDFIFMPIDETYLSALGIKDQFIGI